MPSPSIDDLHRLGDVGVVVERLAHAHQDDGGQQARGFAFGRRPFAVGVAGGHELADDLRARRGCAPGSGCRCGRSGRTGCSRPGRRCRRRRGPRRGRGCRRSRPPGRRGSGTGICGSRRRWSARWRPRGRPMTKFLGQSGLQRLGDRGHAGEVGHALVVDPVPQLLDAEGGFADGRHFRCQFGSGPCRRGRAGRPAAPLPAGRTGPTWREPWRGRVRRGRSLGGHAFTMAA